MDKNENLYAFLYQKNLGGGGASRSTRMNPGGNTKCNIPQILDNHYLPGQNGIGANSIANRRAKNRKATIFSSNIQFPSFMSLGQYSHNPNGFAGFYYLDSSLPPFQPQLSPLVIKKKPAIPDNFNITFNSGTQTATITFSMLNNDLYGDILYTLYDSSGDIIIQGFSSPYVISDLSFNTTYSFTLVASNDVGSSTINKSLITPSNPNPPTSNPDAVLTVPDPPTNITANANHPDEVTVTFRPPVYNGGSDIIHYTVYTRSELSDLSYPSVQVTSTSAVIGNLPPNVSYTFTVTATNSIGDSEESSPARATPTKQTTTTESFTTIGSTSWTCPPTTVYITYLIVGGGGGGGGGYDNGPGGGGGGGLVLTGTTRVTPNQTYTITVGKGGAGATNPTYLTAAAGGTPQNNQNDGNAGDASSFDVIVAQGGGQGFRSRQGTQGTGGAISHGTTAPTGGNGGGGSIFGGGGGGNGSAGSSAIGTRSAGQGGIGISSSISGTSRFYGAGGAGGTNTQSSIGNAGSSNTGNGGGGGSIYSRANIGGSDGGSGIVIIQYDS